MDMGMSRSLSNAPTVIAFDMQEALALVGETGPYVQYAAVRAGRISAKLAERGEALPDFNTLTGEGLHTYGAG